MHSSSSHQIHSPNSRLVHSRLLPSIHFSTILNPPLATSRKSEEQEATKKCLKEENYIIRAKEKLKNCIRRLRIADLDRLYLKMQNCIVAVTVLEPGFEELFL